MKKTRQEENEGWRKQKKIRMRNRGEGRSKQEEGGGDRKQGNTRMEEVENKKCDIYSSMIE